jgi:hypothetical protein
MSKLIWNNNDGQSLRRTKRRWLLINVGLPPLHFLDQRIDPTPHVIFYVVWRKLVRAPELTAGNPNINIEMLQ